jgi:hypothetical protein
MLTIHQVQTVAYLTDGGIICPSCASATDNGLSKELANNGRFNNAGLEALSRYSLDEHKYASAYEYAHQECEHEEGSPEFDEFVEDHAVVCCDGCGHEIDS